MFQAQSGGVTRPLGWDAKSGSSTAALDISFLYIKLGENFPLNVFSLSIQRPVVRVGGILSSAVFMVLTPGIPLNAASLPGEQASPETGYKGLQPQYFECRIIS